MKLHKKWIETSLYLSLTPAFTYHCVSSGGSVNVFLRGFFFTSFLVKYQCSIAYIEWQLGSENFLLNLQGYFL